MSIAASSALGAGIKHTDSDAARGRRHAPPKVGGDGGGK